MRIERLDEVRNRIARTEKPGMKTDVLFFANDALRHHIEKDQALEQAVNVACLPGIVGPSLAMPDIHQGYGFPIGGVAAFDWSHGVVSPGGVGYDINCGVRMALTGLPAAGVRARIVPLVEEIFRQVPCGVGGKGRLDVAPRDLDSILAEGAGWMVRSGYGEPADLEHCEENGCLAGADPAMVSPRARQRGIPQLGTLGSGNHFLEIQAVDRIEDAAAARAFGIEAGAAVVLIHSGSRGLGHQVCTDFLAGMGEAMRRHALSVPDRQLACVPCQSDEGRAYLAAMRAAANFAWANRQAILHFLRAAFERIFGRIPRLTLLYDVCHNIAKREKHSLADTNVDVLVHRKGATRAFPPGHPAVPPRYRAVGQPVLVPGSMGTASWILAGAEGAMRESFGSVCHGAGRLLSRNKAKAGRDAADVRRSLEQMGIVVRSETKDGLLEEVPEAYKDVDAVIDTVHRAGLAVPVARLRPLGVIKG